MSTKSPKYKQRLSAFYQDRESTQNKRANILRGTKASEEVSKNDSRAIALSPAASTYNSQMKFALGSTSGGLDFLSKYIAANKDPLKNPSFSNEELSKEYNPDEAVRNWYVDYISSPKYKERLIKAGYTNPNQVISDRRKRILGTKIEAQTEKKVGSAQNSDKNKVLMDNEQVGDLKTSRDDVLAHELSHVNNSSINVRLDSDYKPVESPSNTSLNETEEKYIGEKNKKVGFGLTSVAEDNSKKYNKTMSHILSEVDHDYSPYENKSDLDAFRYMLKKEGLYDAGEQDFTPELLKKAKNNKNIKKSFNTQRLFKYFSDDDVVDLMNKIATTKTAKSNLA
jgi:hypothetical protein